MKTDGVLNDLEFYDAEPIGTLSQHSRWMREIEYYLKSYCPRLQNAFINKSIKVAELGAGSCGLSVCLSREEFVKVVYAIDISKTRMEKMMATSISILGGDKNKITIIASDFNRELPFADSQLDLIVFDASLHHSRSMWSTLSECRRVLKPGGLLIAQRESFLNSLRARAQLNRLLHTPEVASKVSENMYLLDQYIYYLKVHGFEVEFIKCAYNAKKRWMSILNGYLFSDGVLFCTKI